MWQAETNLSALERDKVFEINAIGIETTHEISRIDGKTRLGYKVNSANRAFSTHDYRRFLNESVAVIAGNAVGAIDRNSPLSPFSDR